MHYRSFLKQILSWKYLLSLWLLLAAMLISGCFDTPSKMNLSAKPASLTIAPGQSVTLTLYNANNTAADGLNIIAPENLAGVSIQGSCTSIPAEGQCLLTLVAAANAPVGTGEMKVTGTNINPLVISIQVAIPPNPAFAVDKSMLALFQNAGLDSVTVTNIGNVNLTGIHLNNLPAGVNTSGGCTTLAVGSQCTFSFTADNTSMVGTYNAATLSAEGISPVQLNIQISPENQGPTATTIEVDQHSLLITKGESASLKVYNRGNYPFNGNLIINTNTLNSQDVAVIPGPDCANLPAGDNCSITINTTDDSEDYNAIPLNFSANNTSNTATTAVSVGLPSLYLDANAFAIEKGGNLSIEVHNGSDFNAKDVRLSGLPVGVDVTASTCDELSKDHTCTLNLTADDDAAPGSSEVTVLYGSNSIDPSPLTFTLTVNAVDISSTDLDNTIYVPVGGSNSITVKNDSAVTPARHVAVTGLPPGVSATPCINDIDPGGSCTITLEATTSAAVSNQPVSITVKGDNTNSLDGQIFVEQPSLSLSSANFTGPGTITVTVTNNSHSTVSNVTPILLLGGGNGISISSNSNNNPCSTLYPQGSDFPATCTFDLTALPNATVSNTSLKVTGTITGLPDLEVSEAIQLPDPQVTINGGNMIIMPNVNGGVLSVPITVAAGGFDLQSPQVHLNLTQGNNDNVNVAFQDANNPGSPCPNPLIAGSSCNMILTNTADLNYTGDGTIVTTGTNLSAPATQQVNVVGGLAINYMNRTNINADYYANAINGPKYSVFLLRNMNGKYPATITGVTLPPSSSFSIVPRTVSATDTDPAYGNYAECASVADPDLNQVNQLPPNAECIVVVTGTVGTPVGTAPTTTLTFNAYNGPTDHPLSYSKTFDLTNTTYLYLGGNFNVMGTARSPNGRLLAECTNGSCQNFLGSNNLTPGAVCNFATCRIYSLVLDPQGNLYVGGSFYSLGTATTTGTNGANYLLAKCANNVCQNYFGNGNTQAAVDPTGSGIYTMAMDTGGNLYVGGSFNSLGSATAGNNYLLAQCKNGFCHNYFGDGSDLGALEGRIQRMIIDHNGNLYLIGGFKSLGFATAGSNNLLAQCTTNNSGMGSCQNYFGGETLGANGYAYTMTVDDSTGGLYFGGDLSALGNIPGDGTALLASCVGGTCQNYFGGNNPGANLTIQGMTTDNNGTLYVGGAFKTLNTAKAGSNDLLAQCTNGSCQNYFGGETLGANGPIFSMITDLNGTLYVEGSFTALGNTTSVGSNNLLAQCSNGSCQNYFGGNTNDVGGNGVVFAMVIGNQLTVVPQP